jgi:hypothetical protein
MITNASGTKVMIPTGRGSYIFYGSKTLDQILAAYDRAFPAHTVMTKEQVIQAHERAKQFAGE